MDAQDKAVLACLRTMVQSGKETATVEEVSSELEMGMGSVEGSLDVLESLGLVHWINGEQAVQFTAVLTVDDSRCWTSAIGAGDEDEDEDDCPEIGDGMTDAEADADTFRSCGWGTDEDYGYFGGDE